MIYALILAGFCLLVGVGALGYYLGRYQTVLLDKIRTLERQARQEQPPEPVKPTVTAGAYQPPKSISTTSISKGKAGLVETKTPELLEWENKQEIEGLGKL